MTISAVRVRLFLGTLAGCTVLSAQAQIATDGTLGGSRTVLTGPDYAIGAHLGHQVGMNLFHSFAKFNLSSGQSAIFSGSGSEIRNVLARVTGGMASTIDGLIKMDSVTLPAANLFLINPKGILFGPNARLDLTGSFHASTADYIKLGGGGRFDAVDPSRDVLTSAPPEAFGFLGPSPAGVVVNGSNLSARNELPDGSLVVREGAGISLVGGPLSLADATLHATSSDIALVGMGSAGEVNVTPALTSATGASAPVVLERSDVRVNGDAAAPGRIVIRGGSVRVADTYLISDNASEVNAPALGVRGTEEVVVRRSLVESYGSNRGAGADIRLSAPDVRIDEATTIGTAAYSEGRGGSIEVDAPKTLAIVSTAADSDFVYFYTYAESSGESGGMRLSADRIEMRAPYLYTYVTGSGNAGPIVLSGRDIRLAEATWIRSFSGPGAGSTSPIDIIASERIHFGGVDWTGTKGLIYAQLQGIGNARDITLQAPNILVKGGNVESESFGPGSAGNVVFQGDYVRFIAGDGAHARAASITRFTSSGDGGNVVVNATHAFVMDGNGFLGDWTHFVTATEGTGRGGDIVIDAPSITIDRANLFARTRFSTGVPGGIRVNADTVTLRNEGGIGSLTEGPRDGASVTVTTRVLDAADTSSIASDATSSGHAGRVTLKAERARFAGVSGISASSYGSGNAGDIVVDISESLELVDRSVGIYQDLGGGGPRGSAVWPGGFSLFARGTGSAGSLHLRAPRILLDDGRIRSTAEAAGNGGRITIEAGTLVMRNGAQIDAKSAQGSTGDAGSMDIRVTGRFEISGHSPVDGVFSGLYAQTQGSGRGGNIDVRADTLSVDRGIIRSSTSGSGRAGAIRIDAGDVALTQGGWIDAGTTADGAGQGGSIRVVASRSLLIGGVDRHPVASVTPPTGVSVVRATLGREQGPVPSAISSNTFGSGAGGNVTLVSPDVTVADGAAISANSSGAGTAGSILVDARPGSIWIDHGSITTQADHSDGGNIALLAGNRLHLRAGEISTSVGGGSGSGGNIFIDPTFVILESARIAANAFEGAGGNINIIAGYFLASPDSRLEASSQLGIAGSIQIAATQSEVVSALPALPAQFLDTSGLLREACTPRAAGASRLVNVGRGGVSLASAGYAPSRYFDDAATAIRTSADVRDRRQPANMASVLLAGICGS